jgi:hypothetical protein
MRRKCWWDRRPSARNRTKQYNILTASVLAGLRAASPRDCRLFTGGTFTGRYSGQGMKLKAEAENERSHTSTSLYAFTTCTLYYSVIADRIRYRRAVRFTLRPLSPSTIVTVRHTHVNFFSRFMEFVTKLSCNINQERSN